MRGESDSSGADGDDRLLVLLEISRKLVATFDLEAILQAATDAVAHLAGLDTAAVYLTEGERLRLWATTPPIPPDFPEALRNAPIADHPHLRAAIERRAPVTLPDMRATDLSPAERSVVAARDLRTVLFIPLVVGGRSTGSLIVGSVAEPKSVSPADVDLSFTVANLVALAVENAQLFHDSQQHVAELKQTLLDRARAERERLELERRLLHAQRLESLGLLAGGIAHDFNNLLLAVTANLQLALRKLPPDAPARPDIEHSVRAARRATDLTGQMLAYSGKGRFEIVPLDLNELVQENAHLFRSSVPRSIDIDVDLGDALPPIEGDVGQLQQVVMNLITNAAEAIGDRAGTIAISTGKEDRSVFLRVSDDGCGMDEATRIRLFEPFFSTKSAGRGLGMAAIQGIVRAHDGAIFVDSAPGKGTSVRVLLPARPQAEVAQRAGGGSSAEVGAATALAGTVLVADDEEIVRSVCERVLEEEGLRVLTAPDGREAVEIFREHADEIDCVILDQTMPNMDGLTALAKVREIRPGAKVLLASGFAERDVVRSGGAEPTGFLQKPYTIDHLLAAVRRALTG